MNLKNLMFLAIISHYTLHQGCKKIILQSYNLDAFDEPNDKEFLDLCPNLEKTCCKMEA